MDIGRETKISKVNFIWYLFYFNLIKLSVAMHNHIDQVKFTYLLYVLLINI